MVHVLNVNHILFFIITVWIFSIVAIKAFSSCRLVLYVELLLISTWSLFLLRLNSINHASFRYFIQNLTLLRHQPINLQLSNIISLADILILIQDYIASNNHYRNLNVISSLSSFKRQLSSLKTSSTSLSRPNPPWSSWQLSSTEPPQQAPRLTRQTQSLKSWVKIHI